jgi:hypothetical protein
VRILLADLAIFTMDNKLALLLLGELAPLTHCPLLGIAGRADLSADLEAVIWARVPSCGSAGGGRLRGVG